MRQCGETPDALTSSALPLRKADFKFPQGSGRVYLDYLGSGWTSGPLISIAFVDEQLVAECEGFEPPFDVGAKDAIGLSRKTQRNIPLRMTLRDTDGAPLGSGDIAAPVVQVAYQSASGGVELEELVESAGKATTGNAFVWDASTARWTYNLATKPYSNTGTYTVSAVAGGDYTIEPTCEGRFVRY